MEDQDINRVLMQFERQLRQVNRACINPVIEELSVTGLSSIINLVARSRARYLKQVYELCKKYEKTDGFPTKEELETLRVTRACFLDLVDGSKSFEISIQRGYLDLKP